MTPGKNCNETIVSIVKKIFIKKHQKVKSNFKSSVLKCDKISRDLLICDGLLQPTCDAVDDKRPQAVAVCNGVRQKRHLLRSHHR